MFASRILAGTSLLLSINDSLKSHIFLDDHIRLNDCHILRNGLAIVSLTFLSKLLHVYHRVSPTHSIAINGVAIRDAGAFHNFLYHLPSVNDLCTASLILTAVFHNHSKGFNTQYSAVLVASQSVVNHVPTIRGAAQTVFHNLFQNSFNHIFEIYVYKFYRHNFNHFFKYVKFF